LQRWRLYLLDHNFLPWVSFVAGIGGSLHCVGMCGGLVTASCDKKTEVFRYQVGRLIGYLILGLFAGFLGSLIKFESASPLVTLIPGIFIGILFLFWGIQNFRGKRAEIPMPAFLGKFYGLLWRKLVYKNFHFTKAFFTGLISIFLPCGLLYGIILGTIALQNPFIAASSMFSFWLGTLPSMIIAPSVIQKILNPIKNQLPKTYAMSLIVIGLMTVSFRVVKYNEAQITAGHSRPAKTEVHSCH
jgi:uncharacterized protein